MIEKVIALLANSSHADGLAIQRLRAVPFTINYRMRTKGGHCKYIRAAYTKLVSNIVIEINHDYCLRATEEEVQNTVSHELAHAYQLLISGDTDHGWMWKSIHRAMGGTAERCHNVEVQKNRVQRHKIVCALTGKPYTVTTRKWNAIKDMKMWDGRPRFTRQQSYIRGQQPAMA